MSDSGGLGARLKQIFQYREVSQTRAQQRLEEAGVPGASQANFYKILAGETSPGVDFVIGVSEEFDVSAGWLLTGEGKIEKEPRSFTPEEAEDYGLQDLPEQVWDDVLELVIKLVIATDTTGLSETDLRSRRKALSRGIAAWLRIPLQHSDKFRHPDSELERIAFCDLALRSLRSLVPKDGKEKTLGGFDRILVELARLERKFTGRSRPRKVAPRKPEAPARIRGAADSGQRPAPRKSAESSMD